ncbi:MAG: 16S rRNA (cytidine(1402)-2'-O)-methyltransferase [Acetobacteraceae bacterium]|nr:16S rRNA (cytidine(1402)-2'-O)-methyltransferase [Acetobacteraceae bacterium]
MEPNDASDPPSTGPFRGLVLVSTPIGNLGDLSPRAVAALRDAETVLCEDTRVTARLLARHSVSAALQVLHDHNEDAAVTKWLSRLEAGARIALVSDAGTPLVSDPGYRLVRAAIAAGVPVTAVPGPNAAVTALTLSGLPPHPFLFHGFLPAKDGPRAADIARIAGLEAQGLAVTHIFYEAPHRAAEALAALAAGLGTDRPAALARELTKLFEEVRRGTLGDLAAGCEADPPRGEVVLVVGPAAPRQTAAEDLDAALRRAMATLSLRDAAAAVAEATGLPRKRVYARALELARP